MSDLTPLASVQQEDFDASARRARLGGTASRRRPSGTLLNNTRQHSALPNSRRTIFAAHVRDCVISPEANWNRFSSCSVMSRYRLRRSILDANNGFKVQ